MTDYDRDRGAYAPSGEAPLAFDPRSQGGRGAGRPPTTLIISVVILLVLVVGVLFMFKSGQRQPGAPPVVGQPLGDIKQAAPASSQPTDEAAGLSIYRAEEAPAAAAPTFAPAPEQPHPLPVIPKVRSAPLPAAAPTPALKGPTAPTRPAPAAAAGPDAAAAPDDALEIAPAKPKAAAAKPAAAPASPPAAAGAGRLVQIGAYSSPGLADKGWSDVARMMPGDMVGRTKSVEPVAKDGQTLYRAYIGGFGSKAEAQTFCGSLKAQGHTCLVK